ncbi:MAG: hypothetical protein ABI772_14065 [Bacteroidota bacterium]
MKIINKIFGFTIISLLLVSFGCKKYEEGPLISFRSKDSRIIGFWVLEYLYINNIDSTEAVKTQTCDGGLFFTIPSKHYHEGNWVSVTYTSGCRGCSGYWSLSHNKKTLSIEHRTTDSCSFRSIGPYLAANGVAWEIRRLTKDQLWLATEYNGQNCWAHFKKEQLQ